MSHDKSANYVFVIPNEKEEVLEVLEELKFPGTIHFVYPKSTDKRGREVRDFIENIDPDGIVVMGQQALRSVFPDAPTKIYSIKLSRGAKVPYITRKGKRIFCSVTHSLSEIKNVDKNEKEIIQAVLFDDIESILAPARLDVDLNPTVKICKTLPLIKECADRLKTEKIVGFDFETTQLKPFPKAGLVSKRFSVAFAFDDGTCYAIPLFNHFPKNTQAAIEEMLTAFFYSIGEEQEKVAHNTKFDMLWGMFPTGKSTKDKPVGKWQDSSLLCWMSDERPGGSGLKAATWKQFGVKNWSIDVENVRSLPLNDVLHYNALDAFYCLRLYQHLKPKVCKTEQGKTLYEKVLIPAALQFLKMEWNGVPIDENKRYEFYKECDKRLGELSREIRKDSGRIDLNPNTPKSIEDYFFKQKKYKLDKKTAGGSQSTDKSVLSDIARIYNDKVAEKILNYKELTKLQSTYVEGLSKHIYDDKRMHGGYNLTATVTGRTSSSDPNMQNFPKRKNKHIRKILVAPPGHLLCCFDYGQIEARLFAVITGDENYLKDLYEGYDIHSAKAQWIFHENMGWSVEDAAKMRSDVKNNVFAAFYGAFHYTVASNLSIEEDLAKRFIDSIFDRYKSVEKWQKEIVEEEKRKGCISTLFGRVRRSPMSFNMILNSIPQGSASDMTLISMNSLGRKYNTALMIHDDISFFLPDDDKLEENINFIIDSMLAIPWSYIAKSPRMKEFAPLQVECEVGRNWGELEPYKTADSISRGFDTLEKSLEKAKEIEEELQKVGW